jgi:superfamily II DNA or RNA helicase
MVDELGQVATLVEALKKENIPFLYAHSGKSKKDLLQIGLEPVDNKEQIEKFNKGEAAVLIGTKAISVGVNIYCAHRTVNWQGGSSETATRQSSVGRSVRKLAGSGYEQYHPPKNKCTIFDFDVEESLELSRALDKRIEYYQMSEVPIKKIVF